MQKTSDKPAVKKGKSQKANRRSSATALKKTEAFLIALSQGGTVGQAAEKAGLDTGYLYGLKKKNTEFAEKWDAAYDAGTEQLEKEAERRALQGVSEPVFYKGEIVGHTQRYSDVLLIFMLKARRPQKFRESVDLTNSDGSIAKAFAAAVRAANGMDER